MTTTTYTVYNDWGTALFTTTDTDEAEALAKAGATVTARSEGTHA